jgi:ABC-2 type transport system permease protein
MDSIKRSLREVFGPLKKDLNETFQYTWNILEGGYISVHRDFREIYDSRSILRSLVAKNLYGKYRNSFLGFAWNFITPLILMILYYIIFTEIKTSTSIENRWVFLSTAIFLFTFLTHCITGGTGAFTGNAGMIKKMYFPREILVLANAISSMIVCLIGYGIVLVTLVITSYPLDWICALLLLPLLALSFVFGVGCIFFLSSIAVYVRDIQYALGSIGIALFIMTPMRYMASEATGVLSVLIWYNPLTYYVEFVHDILYFGQMPSAFYAFMCIALASMVLIIGYIVFRKLRHGFVKRL